MGKTLANVILSGGSPKEDIERAKKAIEQNKDGLPYIISGLGPDTNEAMKNPSKNLDYHRELHNYLLKNTKEFIGVDINSTNTIENIIYTFPKGAKGKFRIISYPLHLKRFELIAKYLKEKGKISKELEFEYVPTKQSFKQFIYGTIALMKTKAQLEEDWGSKFPYNLIKKILKG